jgi:hypothetical protein
LGDSRFTRFVKEELNVPPPLHEMIRAAVQAGRLKAEWTTADLMADETLAGLYTEHNLRSQPANRSLSWPGLGMGDGNNVDKARPRYWRVGKQGKAYVYSLRDDGVPAELPDDAAIEAIDESDRTVEDAPVVGAACVPGEKANAALRQLVRQMQDEMPWDERLTNYIWNDRTFEETEHQLAELLWQGSVFARFVERGVEWNPQDQERAVAWANRIFEWGGTRQKSPVTWTKVRHTLANAVLNRFEHPAAPMNSGYTKVASFATAWLEGVVGRRPQAINDSRVATALTWRLDSILQARGWSPAEVFPGLGKVEAARGGTRPRTLSLSWPSAYQKWSGQFAASAVVLAIRDILNEGGDFPPMPFGDDRLPWTVRGVEAVLFMDGY